LGAVFGPLVALLALYFLKDNIRLTFFLAFIPGVIAVLLLILLVKEKAKVQPSENKKFVKIQWKLLQPKLKLFLLISFVFALGNSSDAFLLLNAKNLGLSTTMVVLVYVLYNTTQTLFATPAGYLSDKLGARKVFAGGLLVFALVYAGFGLLRDPIWLWVLFPIYGLYIAATDGVSKAYISEFITTKESGTFFGAYYFLTSVGTFLASVIGGLLWKQFNPSTTFVYGSTMAFVAFILLIFTNKALRK
jgi:MFS family permease